MMELVLVMVLAGLIKNGGALLDYTDQPGSLCDRTVDVAIVGGGAAGMYAAYRLRHTGQVMELFEYSNRIGGRLYTSYLPNAPDVHVELGGMRFIDGVHTTVQRLVQELNLTTDVFAEGFGKSDRVRYFLRGKHLTAKQIAHGDVPYDLSAEEKANLPRLVQFYLEKLTGFSGKLTQDNVLKLKTKDGRSLHKLTIDEALKLVATPEGMAYLKDSVSFGGALQDNVTALELLFSIGAFVQESLVLLTLEQGMSSLVTSMARAFLESSDSHTITLNRKLEAIGSRTNGLYQLEFVETRTEDGITHVNGEPEYVCAKKVILAIPHLALTRLNWEPLRNEMIKEALDAVIPVVSSKVYFTFSKAWWLEEPSNAAYVLKSDSLFGQMYDWKFSNISGSYVLLASYTNSERAIYMQKLNSYDDLISGSAWGANKVSNSLKEKLLNLLADAFGMRREMLPEPISAVSQFWADYPCNGGITVWKAGYNYNNVRGIIQHPSLLDDIYIVGADHAFLGMTVWIEGALKTVDEVVDTYFS